MGTKSKQCASCLPEASLSASALNADALIEPHVGHEQDLAACIIVLE